jgi:NET1-associated nuclear protein 1 (U3 small nucleolar RNA-associated protein 17)
VEYAAAMTDTTPLLKRKRESAIGLQKKAKKQRKSDTTVGHDAEEEAVTATPVAEQTTEIQATPGLRDKPHSTARKSQTNGARNQDTAVNSEAPPDGSADGDDAQIALAKDLRKQSKKQRKQDYKESKKAEQLSEDKAVEESTAQSTPARLITQVQDNDESAQKKSFKEKVLESKEAAKAELKDLKPFKERVLESKEAAKAELIESKKAQASILTKAKKQKQNTSAKWTVSPAQGGWFLHTDPVFSLDEKYLILANPKSLQVYSTETSLLTNILSVGNTGFVTAYALSSTKPNQVYVADSNGLITLWDWADGTKIGRWDIGATVRNMAVVTLPGSDEDLVYCHETGKSHIVNVHALRTKSQPSKTELKRVLKMSSAITNVQVLLQGKYVIVSTAESITVGKRLKVSRTAVQEFEYIWRELKFSKRVTTYSTYIRQPELSDKGKKTATDQRDILDLAVGDETGVILLFEDILASFAAIESNQKGNKSKTDMAESLRPKRFHWHRDVVGSVKWSLDGKFSVVAMSNSLLTYSRQLSHLWW